ncbi:MAG TPA: hypothetical protein VK018_08135 [Porticoccaceae bacterium]|nr:hypothetical protein [Porticoccaceae bacterium]
MSSNQQSVASPGQQARLETILEAAAEALGDITPAVMALYYQRYPAARQSFVEHGCGYTARLEAGMVDSALYCLMTWFERPLEIDVTLADTVPHHAVLNIPIDYFVGLQEAVVDVIAGTLEPGDSSSCALLEELRAALVSRIRFYAAQGEGAPA